MIILYVLTSGNHSVKLEPISSVLELRFYSVMLACHEVYTHIVCSNTHVYTIKYQQGPGCVHTAILGLPFHTGKTYDGQGNGRSPGCCCALQSKSTLWNLSRRGEINNRGRLIWNESWAIATKTTNKQQQFLVSHFWQYQRGELEHSPPESSSSSGQISIIRSASFLSSILK